MVFILPVSLNLDNAQAVLKEGVAAIKIGQAVFDLSILNEVDSSAVAVLLAWQRLAKEKNQSIQFEQVPSNLKSLLNLYGVEELLVISP